LGRLKDDLQKFNLKLPQLVRLAWWWTDPQRGKLPEPGVWPATLGVLRELAERLGGFGSILRIFKDHRQAPVLEAVRTYLTAGTACYSSGGELLKDLPSLFPVPGIC
jgi:hypothetical protein